MEIYWNKIQEKLSAEKIAFIAVVVWGMSLFPFYPALILYNDDKLWGGVLLLSGWLGPLCMQFAWYANVFFIFAVFFQFGGKRPAFKTSILAMIFIIDSFRYKEILLDEGGGSSAIYGYGLGYIFWVSAISILLISVGVKHFHLTEERNRNSEYRKFIIPISASPLILFILYVVFCSMNYLINGSSHEQKVRKSNSVIFKKYNVCGSEVIYPKKKFNINTNQPLEVVCSGKVWTFRNPTKLLNWGVPKVRMNNYDYYNSFNGRKHTLAATLKKGKSAALLRAKQTKNKSSNKKTITLMLTSFDEESLAFKQNWIAEISGKRDMCPNYSYYPNKNEQPRKVIMDSLIIDKIVTTEDNRNNYKTFSGSLLSENKIAINNKNSYENFGCPSHIGYLSESVGRQLRKEDKVVSELNWPFQINDILYFPGERLSSSICTNKSIYLYKFGRNGKNGCNLYLQISKRQQDTFHEEWFIAIRINELGEMIKAKSPIIIDIEEKANVLIIDLLDSETGKTIKVQSQLTGIKG